ncbi:hypothetical protein ACVDFE_21550 [Lentzea chajnantorensis]
MHRSTKRVVDGMHRLRAAVLRGSATIAVRWFDGSADDAFALSVGVNAAHGLPLTQADRTAAAQRLLVSHPGWSDRAVAATTGLDNKTVAALRRSTEEVPRLASRVGKDGRRRPVDPAPGRIAAAELISANPGASLREIARTAGIAVATVKDVRERMRLGRDVVPARTPDRAPALPRRPPPRPVGGLDVLKNDPSVRHTENGRNMLRLMAATSADADWWSAILDSLPEHCADAVVEAAQQCARRWTDLATRIEQRHTGGRHTGKRPA